MVPDFDDTSHLQVSRMRCGLLVLAFDKKITSLDSPKRGKRQKLWSIVSCSVFKAVFEILRVREEVYELKKESMAVVNGVTRDNTGVVL
jgi:hypothetical protein